MKKKIVPPDHIDGITITTHYPDNDPEMFGDYYDITIDIRAGNMEYHMDYGDYYHDKGSDKAEAFVDAIKLLYGDKVPVLHFDAADRKDIG